MVCYVCLPVLCRGNLYTYTALLQSTLPLRGLACKFAEGAASRLLHKWLTGQLCIVLCEPHGVSAGYGGGGWPFRPPYRRARMQKKPSAEFQVDLMRGSSFGRICASRSPGSTLCSNYLNPPSLPKVVGIDTDLSYPAMWAFAFCEVGGKTTVS